MSTSSGNAKKCFHLNDPPPPPCDHAYGCAKNPGRR